MKSYLNRRKLHFEKCILLEYTCLGSKLKNSFRIFFMSPRKKCVLHHELDVFLKGHLRPTYDNSLNGCILNLH